MDNATRRPRIGDLSMVFTPWGKLKAFLRLSVSHKSQHLIQRDPFQYNQIKFSRVTLKLRNIPQPVIALMKGKAVGSGLAYCLAADVRIGDPTVEISVGANRMGSGGADIGLGFLLPRLCGPAVAAELMLTRRWCKAEKCLAIGVVSDIVAPEKLVEEGRKLAEEMLEMSRMGLMVTKAQLNQGAEGIPLRGAITSEDTAQIFSLQTKDAKVINDRFRTRVQKDRKAKPTL